MLKNSDHNFVQSLIDQSSKSERDELRNTAERQLTAFNQQSQIRPISQEEKYNAMISVEIITRIEAIEKRKGWLYRAKRRPQLVKHYIEI